MANEVLGLVRNGIEISDADQRYAYLPDFIELSGDVVTLSGMISDVLVETANDQIPTSKAVADYINENISLSAENISFDNSELTGYLSGATNVQEALNIVDENLSRTVSSKSNEFFTAAYKNIDLTSTGSYSIYTVPVNSSISISKLIFMYEFSLDYDNNAQPAYFSLGTDSLSSELYPEEQMDTSLFAEQTSEYDFTTRKIYEGEQIIFHVPMETGAAQHQISVIIQGTIITA